MKGRFVAFFIAKRRGAIYVTAFIPIVCSLLTACSHAPLAQSQESVELVQVANRIDVELQKPLAPYSTSLGDTASHRAPFFEDAYGVSDLAGAYQATHDLRYLAAATSWSAKMIEYQRRMMPLGAYYMNYDRAPGQAHGDWFVADSATIGAALIRVSRQLSSPERARYLASVQSFENLVSENYINPDGGIANGVWGTDRNSWWCSTANFGAMEFMLYGETGSTTYLFNAQRAFDWLEVNNIDRAVDPSWLQDPFPVIFYYGEFYAEALPYVVGTPREVIALAQIQSILRWLRENQKSQDPASQVNYLSATYMAGMPNIMYSVAPLFPGEARPADAEMKYLYKLIGHNANISGAGPWALLTWYAWSQIAQLER